MIRNIYKGGRDGVEMEEEERERERERGGGVMQRKCDGRGYTSIIA